MTKSNTLTIVKKMHKDWCGARRFSFFSSIEYRTITKSVASGFCYYLKHRLSLRDLQVEIIVNELKKDKKLRNKRTVYWYPIYDCKGTKSVIRKILQNRINHLQRTITRLETEIKNEN